jgi:hypothetical protein
MPVLSEGERNFKFKRIFGANGDQGRLGWQYLTGDTAYITLWGDDGDALNDILTTTAPAEQIRVESGVDFALNKSLAGDFLVSTFGYKPVLIVISGLDIYKDPCQDKYGDSVETVQSFFNRWNVHANKKARINVGMASAGSTGVAYRCVLVDLKRVTAQELKVGGVGRYTMTLYGTRITK